MKRLCCLLFVALLFSPAQSADPKADDAKACQGTWTVESMEFGGMKLPAEATKTITLILKDNTYVVKTGEGEDKGTFKLDPEKKPKALDITGTEGPNKGKTILAIYELDGDTMRVAYDLAGKERPKEFKSVKDTQTMFAVYKRSK